MKVLVESTPDLQAKQRNMCQIRKVTNQMIGATAEGQGGLDGWVVFHDEVLAQ